MESKNIKHPRPQSQPLTRRQFVTGAAAAAGAFSIVGASAVRGDEANSKIKIGVIGCGGRGAWLAGFFKEHGGYELAALADYFPEVVAGAGESLGVPAEKRYSGLSAYQKLIAEGCVDAVALETPPWFFPQHAEAAADAGLHVFMAKPVAVDVPGCLAIAAAAKRAAAKKRCFLVDFQTRTDPFFQEAIKRAHEGALGRIGLLSSYYTDESFSDPPKTATLSDRFRSLIWVNDVDLGAGYLVNAGIHAVDVALWIAGATPVRAAGSARRCRPEPHGDSCDVYSITYEFASGLIMNHRGEHMNNNHGFTCGCAAYGQGAFLESNYEGKVWIRGGEKAYPGGEVTNLYADGAKRNIATFHDAILAGDCSNPTVEPSVNATLTTILGRDAAEVNGSLTWDEMLLARKRIDIDLSGLVQ